jgi:mannose-6-phosphate isomerase-like protein (cupin superfamily)
MATIALILAVLAQAPAGQAATPPPAQTRKPAILEMRVIDRKGTPLEGAQVSAEGPLSRKGDTDRNGSVTFRNLTAGTYRFRIERQGYIPLEKEVVVKVGTMDSVEAGLTAAPPPPEPPKPVPPPEPPPAPKPTPPPVGEPRALSLIDLAETQPLGRNATRESAVGCSGVSNATVIQLKDGLPAHKHADADELLYVIAGEAAVKLGAKDVSIAAGWFVLVPRGMDHTITRKGRNPIMLLSIMGGVACTEGSR